MDYLPEHIVNQSGPVGDLKITYGGAPDQVIEFYGSTSNPTVLVLIHGGFWRPTIDRSHLQPLAFALSAQGFYVALIEYQRLPGRPYQSLDDVLAALSAIVDKKVILFGHSAGGQLAILAARKITNCIGVIAASPVADLQAGEKENIGEGAINLYLGGSAQNFQDLDPVLLSPPSCRVEIMHTQKDFIPLNVAKNYYEQHKNNSSKIDFTLLVDSDHYTLIDPRGAGLVQLVKVVNNVLMNNIDGE